MKLFSRLTPAKILLIIFFLYIAGFAAHAAYLGKTVYGDGRFYYSWLQLHYVENKFSVGPALLWSPVYVMTHNEFAVGLVSVLAAIFALIVLYDTLSRTFTKTVAIMTVAAVAGASNLLFYGSLDTVNSHAASFFAVTIFLTLLLRKRNWLTIGIALGIVGLMRAQDLVVSILVIPYISRKNILFIISGFVLTFLPQLCAWHLTTGKYFVSPYVTGNEGFTWLQPHLLGVLFNLKNGLFLWTPVTLLGAFGLMKKKYIWFLAVFILQVYIVSVWSTWWQGASYSGRMFVSALPALSFGIASVFEWFESHGWNQEIFILAVVGPLSVINAISIINFLLISPGQ